MKLYIRMALAGAIAMAIAGCGGHHDGHDHEHEGHDHESEELAEGHDHDHGSEGDDEHDHDGHNHGDEIKLKPEMAKKLGVSTQVLKPGTFNDIIAVSGMVEASSGDRSVVAAPTAGIFTLSPGLNVGVKVGTGATIGGISARGISGGDVNEAGRVAIENARREVDRITPLVKQGLATRGELDAATAALNAAIAGYSGQAASGRASSSGAGVIVELPVASGQYVETGQTVAVIARNTRVTLRADVPQKYFNRLGSIVSARFRPDYSDATIDIARLGGKLVSQPATASASGGYVPVYFSLDNDGSIMPGAFAEVYLVGAQRNGVLTVPVEAVVETGGNKFVYVKEHDDAYSKHPVTTGATDGIRVEIIDGVHAGDNVVVKGAGMVRMAETQSVAPPGHSHNH